MSDDAQLRLVSELVLLMADMVTLPPGKDQLRQIFNTASELRRCMSHTGEFGEATVVSIDRDGSSPADRKKDNDHG